MSSLFEAYCYLLSLRGRYTLGLDGVTVEFSAPNPTVVQRNIGRFRSEKTEIRDFVDEVDEEDVVYDIGANTGLYSLFAGQRCTNGEVVSFEPYPPNVDLLKRDVRRNGLRNVEIVEAALSDSVGTVEFSQPAETDAGFGSSVISPDGSGTTVGVPTTTGDRLISEGEIPEPNVVKIDVEGAEPCVIDGLEDALSSPTCRTVYCEVHLPGVAGRPSVRDFGSTAAEVRDRLAGFGFSIGELDCRDSNETFYKAHR